MEMEESFCSLGVDNWLNENLSKLSIHSPTEIQKKSIPLILEGRNVIGTECLLSV